MTKSHGVNLSVMDPEWNKSYNFTQ